MKGNGDCLWRITDRSGDDSSGVGMGMNGPVRKYEVFSLVLKREGVIHEQHIGIGGGEQNGVREVFPSTLALGRK